MSSNKNQKKINKITKLKYAVLICQSFDSDLDSRDCLSKVDNWPAMWYTLNWLGENSVEEVFVIYTKKKEEIEAFFAENEKGLELNKIHLNYVKPGELKSLGDVLRQVQFRNLINEDFLVLYADTLTNLDLSCMIQSHFNKKQQLESVVLTTCMQAGFSKHIHVLNTDTNQILQLQQNADSDFSLLKDKIDLKKTNVSIRRDLNAVEIFICTIDLLKSFKETFEYCTMNDFIVGMLSSEVYEEKINAYVIDSAERAFRSHKAAGLYQLYMAYVSGYLAPYTVHQQDQLQPRHKDLKKELSKYSVQLFNKVIKEKCQVSGQHVKISNNVYIGSNTQIAANCQINQSVILDNCKVEQSTILNNCLVLEGCSIKGNSSHSFCKFEMVNKTLKISPFRAEICEDFDSLLVETDLYEKSVDESQEEQENFEDQLRAVVSEEPSSDTVTDIFTLRKTHNKQIPEVVFEIIKILSPSGLKGVEEFVKKWGETLLDLHEGEKDFLESMLYVCVNSEKYEKGLHVFLQYFFNEQIVSQEALLSWFEAQGQAKEQLPLSMCKPFVEMLQQDDDSEEDEDDGDDDQN